MNRRDQLKENYEDALFALLMEEVAEQEGKRLLDENEQLKQDPEAAIPNEVSLRCHKAIRQSFAKEQRRAAGRFMGRMLSKVSLAAMIGTLLFATAFAAVPEIRIRTLNFLIEISDVSTSLRLVSDESGSSAEYNNAAASATPETLWDYRLPEIPEEFSLEYQNESSHTISRWYSNEEGATIIFEIYKADDSGMNVDTENAQVENIQIHGYDGLLIEKENSIDIIWGDTDMGNFVSVRCTNMSPAGVLSYADAMEYYG